MSNLKKSRRNVKKKYPIKTIKRAYKKKSGTNKKSGSRSKKNRLVKKRKITRKFYYQSGGGMNEIITSINKVILEPIKTQSIQGKRNTLQLEINRILQSKTRDKYGNYSVVIEVFMGRLSNIIDIAIRRGDMRELEKLIELIRENQYPIGLLVEKVKAGLKLTDESTLREGEKIANANLHEISEEVGDKAVEDIELRNKVFDFAVKCVEFSIAPFRGAIIVHDAQQVVIANKDFINEIITARDGMKCTLLSYLVKQKYLEFDLIKTIVENGGDINAIDSQGKNFLISAIDLIYDPKMTHLSEYYKEIIIKCINELNVDILKETEYYKMNAKNYISFLTLKGVIQNGANEQGALWGDIFSNIFYIKENSIWKDPTFDLVSYIIKTVDTYLSLVVQIQILKATDPGNLDKISDLLKVIQIKIADIKMCVFNNPTIVTKICSNTNARYNNKHLLTFIVSNFDYNVVSPIITEIAKKYFEAYNNNYVESHSRFRKSQSSEVNIEELKKQAQKSALLAFNVADGTGQTVLSIIDRKEPNNKKKIFYLESGFFSPIEIAKKILAATNSAEENRKKLTEMIHSYQTINAEEVGTLLEQQEKEENDAKEKAKTELEKERKELGDRSREANKVARERKLEEQRQNIEQVKADRLAQSVLDKSKHLEKIQKQMKEQEDIVMTMQQQASQEEEEEEDNREQVEDAMNNNRKIDEDERQLVQNMHNHTVADIEEQLEEQQQQEQQEVSSAGGEESKELTPESIRFLVAKLAAAREEKNQAEYFNTPLPTSEYNNNFWDDFIKIAYPGQNPLEVLEKIKDAAYSKYKNITNKYVSKTSSQECGPIRRLIPYYTNTIPIEKQQQQQQQVQQQVQQQEQQQEQKDSNNKYFYYKNELCIIGMLMAFITHILKVSQTCDMILKGGKSIQMYFAEPSNDYDFNIRNIHPEISEKIIAIEIFRLLAWLLPKNNQRGLEISGGYYKDESDYTTMTPIVTYGDIHSFLSIPKTKQTILKVSLKGPAIQHKVTGDFYNPFIPVMDLGCGYEQSEEYIKTVVYKPDYIETTGEIENIGTYPGKFLFIYLSLEALLRERLYYWIKNTLEINELSGLENPEALTKFKEKTFKFYDKLPKSIYKILNNLAEVAGGGGGGGGEKLIMTFFKSNFQSVYEYDHPGATEEDTRELRDKFEEQLNKKELSLL